jgi:hypothetical protein
LSGLFWTVDVTPTSAILSVSAIPGDIDLDGDVDRSDLSEFTRHYGSGSGALWTSGDFNGDGATTLTDLGLLQSHYGQSRAAAAAVPEPSTLALATLATVGWLFRTPLARKRGRRPAHTGVGDPRITEISKLSPPSAAPPARRRLFRPSRPIRRSGPSAS